MSTNDPQPTDTPGIFRCPVCGLQNPRPIKKPFIHQCGPPPEPRHPDDVEYPPLRTQVKNFLTAMAQFAGDGFKTTDAETFDRRVAICQACDTFDRAAGRCRECGCYGKLKAKGKVWTCPKGKWPDLTIAQKVE